MSSHATAAKAGMKKKGIKRENEGKDA